MIQYLTTNVPGALPHGSVALGDVAAGIGAMANTGCVRVQMTCEGDVRCTYDGSNPSNAVGSEAGHKFLDGYVFDVTRESAERMLFVSAVPGVAAALRVTEFTEAVVAAEPVWKAVRWLEFLKRVARRRQVDPLSGAFSREWVAMATEFISSRLGEVWHSAEWPPLMVVEERAYPDPDDKYIPWREDGEVEVPEDGVNTERCLYAQKPDAVQPPRGKLCSLSVRGVEVLDSTAPASVCWLRYRGACPQFTVEKHDPAATYFYGDLVYDSNTGECYLSRMDNNQDALDAGAWSKQIFPDLLADAVMHFVLADLLEEDGQQEKAGRQLAYAEGFLMDMQERVLGNGGRRAVFVAGN
jgi:hypothetical protein